jgi:hypothetical protein
MATELDDFAAGICCEFAELLFGAFAELDGLGVVDAVEEELLEVAATLDLPFAGESGLLESADFPVDVEDLSNEGIAFELFGSSKGSVEVELSLT